MEGVSESASQSESAGETAITITDSTGAQITLDTRAPRVVAAYSSFAESWLLAGGELCGVTQDALEERDLGLPEDTAVVGTVKEPNAEEIIALEPDLVILAQDIAAQTEVKDVLENAGLACASFQVDTFEDYAFMMEQFTAITGGRTCTSKTSPRWESRLGTFRKKPAFPAPVPACC